MASGVVLIGAVVGLAASVSVVGVDDIGSGSASVDVVAPFGVRLTEIEWVRKLDNEVPILFKVNTTFAELPLGGDCGPGDGCTAHFAIKADGATLATNTVSPFELSTSGETKILWDLLDQTVVVNVLILGINVFAVMVVDPDS